ncbi:hypothetical protein FACS1894120_0870 [Clostridia bacterium]|nr:hypothetical protein FACS1894120_0870 [Clostridia bacterium]
MWRNFIKTDIYADCETLLTYVSTEFEPDTRSLITHAVSDGKAVFVPRTYSAGLMNFFRVRDLSELTAGRFGIPEPDETCEKFSPDECGAVCVVPALCYNTELHRIGYGGGYYDRFLSGAGVSGVTPSEFAGRFVKVIFCDTCRDFVGDEFDVRCDFAVS